MAVAALGFVCYWVILPNFVSNGPTKHTLIWNRLRQLDAAKERWTLEKGIAEGIEPSMPDLTPYLQEGFWDRPVAGERCIINGRGTPVQALLTRRVGDYPSGTTLELTLDGVLVEKAPNQVGAANGSQPIRSETNRTSSAAGSRR